MIGEFLEFTEGLNLGLPIFYGRKAELNVKLANIKAGDIVIAIEEPTEIAISRKAFSSVPVTPFLISVVSPVPLERDSLKNVEVLDEAAKWANSLIEKIYASKRFRVSGDISVRKVQEREFDLNCIGWRFTARLTDIKRERCPTTE